jgi:hypothetical protein
MTERRKFARRRVLKAAKIVFNHGHSIVDCAGDGAWPNPPSTVGRADPQ